VVPLGLRVIVGPAGSGKTTYIVRSVVERLLTESPRAGVTGAPGEAGVTPRVAAAHAPAILLVPDQATFQMERRILEDPRVEGFMDVHVLSFRRLSLRALEETGGLSLPFITAVGRSMAIQSILWERRKDLTVFAPMVNYPGFRETLGKTLSELAAYDVTPSSMKRLGAAETMPFLGQKIHDLGLVFEEYREFLKGRFFDPDDYLELAAERIPVSRLVRGATVWIDGFSGFTPKEYKVLRAVMTAAHEVILALCIDRDELARPAKPTSLFNPTRETYDKVMATAWDAGVPVDPVLYLGGSDPGKLPRFREASDLGTLELKVRADGGGPVAPERDAGTAEVTASAQVAGAMKDRLGPCVRIVSATSPLAELEFVAREIIRLVRDDGLRFRDITVEARDLSGYAEMLPLVFRDHGIPFFLDRKRSLSHHPLAELIRAALDVVLTSWSFESVFRYLKTDLALVERAEVDELENYVLSHGIVGEKWISPEPWRYVRRYLAQEDDAGAGAGETRASRKEAEKDEAARRADAIRKQAIQGIADLYRRLKQAKDGLTAQDVSQAVCALLLELDVPKKLAQWQSVAEQAGDLSLAVDHAALWDRVMEILGQAGEILKDQPHDLKSYSLLISAGLEDVRLGAIPPSLDQVLVGSLDRSRQPDCKVTFLIGALMGVFPKRQTEDSIFTDAEREYLQKKGVDLEPASTLRQFHEKYLVYIALTRPSRRLYLSYPLGDQEGKALTPSHVVDLVKQAVPGLEEELVSGDPPDVMPAELDFVVPARVRGIAVRKLSLLRKNLQPGDAWAEAYRWLIAPERAAASRRVLSSLGYSNKVAPLDRALVKSLYGQTLITSVSRLETFGACPFWQFARDGLGLRERDIFRLEPADAGVFLHAALKGFVEEVQRSGRDWDDVSGQEALRIVDAAVERLVPEVAGELFLSSARYKYVAVALRRILRRAGGVLLSHMQRGAFRPVAAEFLFGFLGGPKPLRIALPGKEEILLRGQIDRIDAASGPDGLYVRVVDYKSSPRSLDLTDVYSGLVLQLLVYMLVVLESWKDVPLAVPPLPGGVLYFSVIDPLISKPGPVPPEEAERDVRKKLRMSGLVAGDLEDGTLARLMDREGSGYSEVVPVQFRVGGGLGAKSSAVAPRDLSALLGFVKDKVRDMAGEIFSGRADIAPYRRGARRACQYCPYGPLCSFDILVDGNQYRVLKTVPEERLWVEVRKHGQPEGGIARD